MRMDSKRGEFQIVAHRGVATEAPENTLPAFQQALALGADAVELDVRLSADHVPVVFHYFYLDYNTDAAGPVFQYTWEQLKRVNVRRIETQALGQPQDNDQHELMKSAVVATDGSCTTGDARISSLAEILDLFAGKIELEIEVKGPEPEAPQIIGALLKQHRRHWDTMEVTSYEPALLLRMGEICPGLPADLLIPRTENWMGLDVMAYQALQRARLSQARALHLHPSQTTEQVVSTMTRQGFQVHAWDVNDEAALELTANLGITRICTDRFLQAKAFRQKYQSRS